MKRNAPHILNEDGYVLVTAMMILVVLTIIGIISTKSTVTELIVSGNDKLHKQTFYMADGGTELTQRITFENAICSTVTNGFTKNTTYGGNDATLIQGKILVQDLTFANNTGLTPEDVSDSLRAVAYYPDATIDNDEDHTNFYTTARTTLLQGSGAQMISGYESLGAGAPGGGTAARYTIASQHHGLADSQSFVEVGWRLDTFVIRSASTFDCIY